MSRHHLNLTAGAWKQVRRAAQPRLNGALLWQSLVAGPVFSGLERLQTAIIGQRRAETTLAGSIVILGYWRSGTTLLHELLCLDQRFAYPTTDACMNPQSFAISRRTSAPENTIARPMDGMMVGRDSPQEDEFALLGLGARSPYEALLFPERLAPSLTLCDPGNLEESERENWRRIFLDFLRGVSLIAGGRPLILKSPPHSYRIPTLRELLPDARFIIIVRNPYEVFESAVRMWRELFNLYALTPPLSDDAIREIILADRPRMEAKLLAGCANLPTDRLAHVRYEELIARPIEVIETLYERLALGDFAPLMGPMKTELKKRETYQPRAARPSDSWSQRIATEWADIIDRHGY